MVLGTIIIVAILITVILSIISSQSRITQHQVSRIQAYYAAQAGMNYALEMLRTGLWTFNPPFNSCQDPFGQVINDSDFPNSIGSFDGSNDRQFRVIFCPENSTCAGNPCNPPTGIDFCVDIAVEYIS